LLISITKQTLSYLLLKAVGNRTDSTADACGVGSSIALSSKCPAPGKGLGGSIKRLAMKANELIKIRLNKELKEVVNGFFSKELNKFLEEKERLLDVLNNLDIFKREAESFPKEINPLDEGYVKIRVTKLIKTRDGDTAALGGVYLDNNRSEKIYIPFLEEKGRYMVKKEDLEKTKKGWRVLDYKLHPLFEKIGVVRYYANIDTGNIYAAYGYYKDKYSRKFLVEKKKTLPKKWEGILISGEDKTIEDFLADLKRRIEERLSYVNEQIEKIKERKEAVLADPYLVMLDTSYKGGGGDWLSKGLIREGRIKISDPDPNYEFFLVSRDSDPRRWEFDYPKVPKELVEEIEIIEEN